MKTLIDAVRFLCTLMPIAVRLRHTDRYVDRSLVAVSVFGWAAAYVITPDAHVHTAGQRGDLGVARRIGYALHEAAFARWVRQASSHDLLRRRDAEVLASANQRNWSLIAAIQAELDRRIGYRIAA